METLETKRLLLRPFTEYDVEDTYAYSRDPRVGPSAGWQPHRTIQESLEVIRSVFSQPNIFAVVDKRTGRVIGSAGYVGRSRGTIPGENDEIGYALSPDYWGQGLIPEAVERLLQYGFEDLGLAVIWCNHYEGNEKSRRVIEKCGFHFQGKETEWVEAMAENRTVCLYAMARKEWAR